MTTGEREALRAGVPADAAAERAVLAEIMRTRTIPDAVRALTADHFTVRRHIVVFEAALRQDSEGKQVDELALAEHLGPDLLASIGGVAFLSELMDALEYSGDIRRLVGRLEDCRTRRLQLKLADRIARQAVHGAVEPRIVEELAQLRSDGASRPEPAPSAPWPALRPEALYGLPGDIVRAIDPYTEADPAAVLVQLLAGFGAAVGHGPYFRAGADEHYMNLYAVLVGSTSRGRKGSSWNEVLALLGGADEEWTNSRIQSGLSSGEGLIWSVRDPITEIDGRTHRPTVVDPGVVDKRLLVIEPEYSGVLRVCERTGNTLSAQIRQAWDSGTLRVLTKNKAAQATGAHISIIAHITRDELLRYLTATEQANGFANRFLWICVTRSKLLPEPGRMPATEQGALRRRLAEALHCARTVGEMERDDDARAVWREAYARLSAERLGLVGAVTSRAEAQTLRLSCLYALLDSSRIVRAEHLTAAL